MRELDPDYEALGFDVRFVTIGDRAKAEEFCGRFGDASLCVPDETKASYAAMGFGGYDLANLWTDPPLQIRRAEANAAGFQLNKAATDWEDAKQLHGAAVIDRDGLIRWMYRGIHPADLPKMDTLLEIARATFQRTAAGDLDEPSR